MSTLNVDMEDFVPLVLFSIAGLVSLGLATQWPGASYLQEGFWAFSDSGTTVTISWGMIVSLSSLGAIMYTNSVTWSSLGGIQLWLVLVTIWLILAPPFVPILGALLSSQFAAMIAFIIQTTGAGSLAYMG